MNERSHSTLSALIARARGGDAGAVGTIFSTVYDELREVARIQRRRRSQETLNTTALIHEAYIKLAGQQGLAVRDRAHFMAVAATAMRQVLIDHARKRLAAKRGGERTRIPFHEIESALSAGPGLTDLTAEAVLALDDALARLGRISERQSRVVECRFFAGLSIDETADALDTSPATVKRDWAMAQAWLYRDLKTTLG